jgi:hypothetical protein
MNPKVTTALENFADALETEYGELEGVELRFEHPIVEGEPQAFATVKKVTLLHLTRTEIELE